MGLRNGSLCDARVVDHRQSLVLEQGAVPRGTRGLIIERQRFASVAGFKMHYQRILGVSAAEWLSVAGEDVGERRLDWAGANRHHPAALYPKCTP